MMDITPPPPTANLHFHYLRSLDHAPTVEHLDHFAPSSRPGRWWGVGSKQTLRRATPPEDAENAGKSDNHKTLFSHLLGPLQPPDQICIHVNVHFHHDGVPVSATR
jgi:hypothetical protein